MNNQSSNIIVEAQLKQLGTIKKVAPPADLFERTMNKITSIKKSYVSVKWVRVAAAVFVFALCAELTILLTQRDNTSNKLSQQEELETLIPNTNYNLYYD